MIDDYKREIMHIEVNSMKSSRVIWILNHLMNRYAKPGKIRMGNGPEFIANIAGVWSLEPGK
ncbi:hypothetical protein ASG01_15290 [Chryseobacterium sp. Leaf180]|nr:hypothetical protein ASG01_15290 [Chryseobacterium sp. Leaf180]